MDAMLIPIGAYVFLVVLVLLVNRASMAINRRRADRQRQSASLFGRCMAVHAANATVSRGRR